MAKVETLIEARLADDWQLACDDLAYATIECDIQTRLIRQISEADARERRAHIVLTMEFALADLAAVEDVEGDVTDVT